MGKDAILKVRDCVRRNDEVRLKKISPNIHPLRRVKGVKSHKRSSAGRHSCTDIDKNLKPVMPRVANGHH